MMRFMIASPSSGAGKTVITLAIMRLMSRIGIAFQPAKSGPDYIDPQFHYVAASTNSINLDAWAMSASGIQNLVGNENLIVEGAMGLFDGAGVSGTGSSADLANILSLPIVLVIDAGKTAQSIAAIVKGFINFDNRIKILGVILNRVASYRHLNILKTSLSKIDVVVIGFLLKSDSFSLAERHLGLVQASETHQLDRWIDNIADALAPSLDITTLTKCDIKQKKPSLHQHPKPPGQRIAVAKDIAFGFSYPHQLKSWHTAGATISFFSPLADEEVPEDTDFIFLPGGYPELHAKKIATAYRFKSSIHKHSERNTKIYGECGGYMVLGDSIIDEYGSGHEMLGLLRLVTSFEKRKLHLGYRELTSLTTPLNGHFRGHEFHFATTIVAEGKPLFSAKDADGIELPAMGLSHKKTFGSFAHIISEI